MWFRADLGPGTLDTDTGVFVGQGVEQTLLVTWNKDSPWLAIVAPALEAVRESARDFAELSTWRVGQCRSG